MSIAIMSLVFEIKNQLTPTEKLILLELADHANDQGSGIWPSIDTICDRTSLTRNPVRETLSWLTEAGILVTEEEPTAHSSTKRRINVSFLRELKQAGERDQKHMLLEAARATRTKQKETEKPARGSATHPQEKEPKNPLGVTYSPPEGHLLTPRGGATHPRGSATHPESSINHYLNINESGMDDPRYTSKRLWEMIDQQLQAEMSMGNYAQWVRSTRPVSYQDGVLTVACSNAYGRDWCQSRLGVQVSRLATAIAGAETRVVFELESHA